MVGQALLILWAKASEWWRFCGFVILGDLILSLYVVLLCIALAWFGADPRVEEKVESRSVLLEVDWNSQSADARAGFVPTHCERRRME